MLFDRVSFNTSTIGIGTITSGVATVGFRTMADAAIPNGTSVEYAIEDGNAWETGTGVVGSNATTLTRILSQSSTGNLLVLGGAAKCFLTPISSQYNLLSFRPPLLTGLFSDFPVVDQLSICLIPSPQSCRLNVTDPANPRIDQITDSASKISFTSSSLAAAPQLKYSPGRQSWYLATDGASPPMVSNLALSRLVNADQISTTIVAITTNRPGVSNFYNYVGPLYQSHACWVDGNVYFDAENYGLGRHYVNMTGDANDTKVNCLIMSKSPTNSIININGVVSTQPSAGVRYSDGHYASSSQFTLFGTSKHNLFSFMIFNRSLSLDEMASINEWKNRRIGNSI